MGIDTKKIQEKVREKIAKDGKLKGNKFIVGRDTNIAGDVPEEFSKAIQNGEIIKGSSV